MKSVPTVDVSVVIPILNAEEYIRECIEQLANQDYPLEKIEVLIADGGSTDKTLDIVEKLGIRGLKCHIINVGCSGRAQGLNAAIRAARGEAICRLDARTRVGVDYIRRCVETLVRTGAWNVGGLLVPVGKTPAQRAIAIAMTHLFGVGDAKFRIAKKSGFVDTVYLGFFRREVFQRVGFFDETGAVISEDSDFNFRIRKAGGSVFLNVDIPVSYHVRSTIGGHFSLYFRYGGARAGNIIKHGCITSLRQIVPAGFVVVLVFGGVLGFFWNFALICWLMSIGLYVCCNVGVSLGIGIRRRVILLVPLVGLSFFMMHFGFGLGFWRRLLGWSEDGAAWRG